MAAYTSRHALLARVVYLALTYFGLHAAESSDGSAGVDVGDSKAANDILANGVHANGGAAAAAGPSCKHSAANFDAEAVPLSSFMLNGQDYSKERSLRVSKATQCSLFEGPVF